MTINKIEANINKSFFFISQTHLKILYYLNKWYRVDSQIEFSKV